MFGGSAYFLGLRRGTYSPAHHTFIGSVDPGAVRSRSPPPRGYFLIATFGILILVGGILTWLAFSNVLGSKGLSDFGPLLIAIALLLFLVSLRLFMIARQRRTACRQEDGQQNGSGGAVIADEVNREEVCGTEAVVMNTIVPVMPEVVRDTDPNLEPAPPPYTEINEQETSVACCEDIPDDPPPSYDQAMENSEPVVQDLPLREEIIPAADHSISQIFAK